MAKASYYHGEGFVYFITDDHGHIKIGLCSDVLDRLAGIQTGNPHKCRVLGCIRFAKYQDAMLCEKALHEMFEGYALEGEWFKAEPVFDFLNQKNDIEIIYRNACVFTVNGFKDVFEELNELRNYCVELDAYNPYAWGRMFFSSMKERMVNG